MKKGEEYQVFSPDEVSIFKDITYPNLEKASKAFREWRNQFKAQGYYSSNKGKINLKDLPNEVTVKLVPVAELSEDNEKTNYLN